jgi:hypothetical protein
MSNKLDPSGQLGILVEVMLEGVGLDVAPREDSEGDDTTCCEQLFRRGCLEHAGFGPGLYTLGVTSDWL